MPRKIPTGHPALDVKLRETGDQRRRPDIAAIKERIAERQPAATPSKSRRPDAATLDRLKASLDERTGRR